MIRLTDILDEARVCVPLQATDKRGAIEELVELLRGHSAVSDPQAVLQAVLEREATRTTGIGNGLALPHGKTASVRELVVALGKPAAPIDFDSIDGKPVDLIVLLASPADQAGPHIQALARISRLMTLESFRMALDRAKTGPEVYQIITRQEEAMARGSG